MIMSNGGRDTMQHVQTMLKFQRRVCQQHQAHILSTLGVKLGKNTKPIISKHSHY